MTWKQWHTNMIMLLFMIPSQYIDGSIVLTESLPSSVFKHLDQRPLQIYYQSGGKSTCEHEITPSHPHIHLDLLFLWFIIGAKSPQWLFAKVPTCRNIQNKITVVNTLIFVHLTGPSEPHHCRFLCTSQA